MGKYIKAGVTSNLYNFRLYLVMLVIMAPLVTIMVSMSMTNGQEVVSISRQMPITFMTISLAMFFMQNIGIYMNVTMGFVPHRGAVFIANQITKVILAVFTVLISVGLTIGASLYAKEPVVLPSFMALFSSFAAFMMVNSCGELMGYIMNRFGRKGMIVSMIIFILFSTFAGGLTSATALGGVEAMLSIDANMLNLIMSIGGIIGTVILTTISGVFFNRKFVVR